MWAKIHKNVFKFQCYLDGVNEWLKPQKAVAKRLNRLQKRLDQGGDALLRDIDERALYYNRLTQPFSLADAGIMLSAFSRTKSWSYFFDYKRCFRYFPQSFRVNCLPGDVTHIPGTPTLVKSRPISQDNQNSVILKLNRIRHYYFYTDSLPFEEKDNALVWRGKCLGRPQRISFVKSFDRHPLVDAGDTHKNSEGESWHRDFMSIPEQLRFKFILSIEGKDVATNLKWIMASHSVCFTPRPQFETWFMEGILKPGVHYVEIKEDFSDIEDKIRYYINHPDEASQIIQNANAHVTRFLDPEVEDLVMLRVLSRYFELSGQAFPYKHVIFDLHSSGMNDQK